MKAEDVVKYVLILIFIALSINVLIVSTHIYEKYAYAECIKERK